MMRAMRCLVVASILAMLLGRAAAAPPTPTEADWTVRDFRFHGGEVLPALRIHYTTLGDPSGEPVLILHGTGGSGTMMLSPPFGGELFGPGQPLDASRYYVILPDAIGHGGSSKPSDGLRAAFPKYDYQDLVDAVHRLVVEHLGIRHLRVVIGNSMGGMETWLYAERHPAFIDLVVPMASQPAPMAGRNWMLRRLIVDSIRNDPDWRGGDYAKQPRSARVATVFFNFATSGGNQALQKQAPTGERADVLVDQRLAAPFLADANDVLFQWDASRDFDPSAGLEKITARVLAINSADDERNPPELGTVERGLKRIGHGRLLLIPASDETAGHATTFFAKWWKRDLVEELRTAPRAAAGASD